MLSVAAIVELKRRGGLNEPMLKKKHGAKFCKMLFTAQYKLANDVVSAANCTM